MKKIPILLLLIMPYAQYYFFHSNMSSAYLALFRIFPIIFLFNLIYPFFLPRMGYSITQMFFWNMLIKLFHLPFYIYIIRSEIDLMGDLLNPEILPGVLILLGLILSVFLLAIILLIFCALLPSTMYGISGLRQLYKAKQISLAGFIFNILLQFIWGFDLCSAIYLYVLSKKNS